MNFCVLKIKKMILNSYIYRIWHKNIVTYLNEAIVEEEAESGRSGDESLLEL